MRGRVLSKGLRLEFWADTPGGATALLQTAETEMLAAGEVGRYRAEFTPDQVGIYEVHAYLYDQGRRIGHQVETISTAR